MPIVHMVNGPIAKTFLFHGCKRLHGWKVLLQPYQTRRKLSKPNNPTTPMVDVTCYWPQIDITKNGDTLSKIGDKVYYDITLFNNTPVAAGMRALSCTITDALIGFNKDGNAGIRCER